MLTEGFVVFHRKMVNWQWYDDINVFRVFTHLILTANWNDKKWRDIIVKRGQKVTSIGHLSSETGLTVRQVRTALNKLVNTGEIILETTNKYTLVTIVNYSFYQDKKEDNDKQTTNEGQTDDKQTTNEGQQLNKDNKATKITKVSSSILKFYEENIGMFTPTVAEMMNSYLDDFSDEMIIEAIRIASLRNKKNARYIQGILNNWLNKGYKTIGDVKSESNNNNKSTGNPFYDLLREEGKL